MARPATTERFLARLDKTDSGCWEWRGAIGTHGYGVIGVEGNRTMTTHRLSWMLFTGEIPDGLFVLHRCDNKRCANPDHLYLGSVKDNARDLWERGQPYAEIRRYITPEIEQKRIARLPRGRAHHRSNAKLTEEQARAVFVAQGSQRAIAAAFGLTQQAVSRIKTRQNWRHIHVAS